ncbi:HPr family phosphocarrier protein [Prosthecobacter sp.]|jgi:phosphocarrier protein HPr|uniref:HPr family phosphocarrier protein n=1 Tax=Prosthecobacter sp. TaxID=1965333 RepID=UPI000BDDD332|nr:HPr family phosphocarrier protein [Prosthecobacter sp.]MDZ4405727.1 HPr family phosphocarrier protein [Prosthecobacter sp.]OYW27869.1 MAG: phosphocarrier protein HPr [Chthoniobacter sp. 12-60-6]
MSIQKELTIRNKMGMHARPAAQFVKRASKYQCDVWVEKDDEPVNGKSIMGLMMLAAGRGETIKIIADGNDAEAAVADLEELVTSGFGDVE